MIRFEKRCQVLLRNFIRSRVWDPMFFRCNEMDFRTIQPRRPTPCETADHLIRLHLNVPLPTTRPDHNEPILLDVTTSFRKGITVATTIKIHGFRA